MNVRASAACAGVRGGHTALATNQLALALRREYAERKAGGRHRVSYEKIKQKETGIMFSAISMKVPKNEV